MPNLKYSNENVFFFEMLNECRSFLTKLKKVRDSMSRLNDHVMKLDMI